MTVKELIEKLQEMPQDALVRSLMWDDNDGSEDWFAKINDVYTTTDMDIQVVILSP